MRSKTLIIILVVALSVVLGISGILLGLILGNHKQDAAPQNTASGSSGVQITTQQTTTETMAVSETSTTVSEAETTTVTTVTTAPKPVITKAYLYYFNTGAGVKLYLHAEGNFASYQYQLYFKMPGQSEYSATEFYGENSVEEFLVAEGLGGYGIESYKADLTAWNQDKSQSVQQWAYVDLAKSSHPVDQPTEVAEPTSKTYLFGGYVATKTDDLNLRSKPDQSAKVVAKIPTGTQLMIYASGTEGWYWTEYNGKSGYVSAKYIREIEAYDPGVSPDSEQVSVYECNETGVIRTKGETVPGFTTSYICEGGAKSMVRTSLGDGWHIQSNRCCYAKNTTWYELYDAWDGDYYGWVAESYIAFDP